MIATVENSHMFTIVNLVLSYVVVIHIGFLRSDRYQHRNLFVVLHSFRGSNVLNRQVRKGQETMIIL